MLIAICIAFAMAVVGWRLFKRGGSGDSADYVTTTAWKGPYEFTLIEPGTIDSASSVAIRSEVRVRGGMTQILEVVPEGAFVEAGQTVVELDSSSLREDENLQRIVIANRMSQLATAENTLAAAKIAKSEYLEGLYATQEQTLAQTVFTAKRAKDTAEAALESAKALYADGIYTALQVESAHSSLESTINNFDAAETALSALRNLTKRKELTLLEANIASAQAEVQAQLRSLRVEQERLKFVQQQIANCTIKAPAAGQAVYANETESYRGSSQSQFVVAPGAMVRERQVILYLPDPRDMQVKATINEARVTAIRPGMSVTVRVPALRNALLAGEVKKVNQFAEPPSNSSDNIRRYATLIKIKSPPADLRVGMNAEARIHIEQQDNVIQVPVQALAEANGHYYALVHDDDHYETREVSIASTNDQVATIDSGLAEGDEVLMHPRSAGDLLELPVDEPLAVARIADHQVTDVAATDAGLSADDLNAQFVAGDTNHDDRLSRDEMSELDDDLQQLFVTGDANGDGLLERRELLRITASATPRSHDKPHGSATAPHDPDLRRRTKRPTDGEQSAGG
jgi:multidrug efflux pump subunit AcrA (membrane-fusion protein)